MWPVPLAVGLSASDDTVQLNSSFGLLCAIGRASFGKAFARAADDDRGNKFDQIHSTAAHTQREICSESSAGSANCVKAGQSAQETNNAVEVLLAAWPN
jgi:hypothetical protein|eukprot:COSAG02_NODE_5188_length_4558_cov_2.133887_3_plen_99_part_00